MEVEFKEGTSGEGQGKSKCLLLGGYVVLDHSNTGICIDLDPKVTTRTNVTKLLEKESVVKVESHPSSFTATFTEKDWGKTDSFQGKFERFILASLHVFFTFFRPTNFAALDMTITGDPEFYCESGKTGLGSSSATTVSILSSLLKMVDKYDADLLFKLSAVAHSFAQGKLGSCFDISAAIWGSQVYRRPSADRISITKVNDAWDNEHKILSFPKNTKLWLVNSGFAGSSTQNLVKLFNKHKEEDADLFISLVTAISEAEKAIENGVLGDISSKFNSVKNVQRRITENWGVSILPHEIDSLIAEIEKIPGVITAIPPGAGGYDAVAVLTSSEFRGFDKEFKVLATRTF